MSLVQELVQYCQSFEYNQVHQLRTISNKNFGQIYFSFPFNEGLGNTASFQTRTVWSEQASSQSMMEEYTSDVFLMWHLFMAFIIHYTFACFTMITSFILNTQHIKSFFSPCHSNSLPQMALNHLINFELNHLGQ